MMSVPERYPCRSQEFSAIAVRSAVSSESKMPDFLPSPTNSNRPSERRKITSRRFRSGLYKDFTATCSIETFTRPAQLRNRFQRRADRFLAALFVFFAGFAALAEFFAAFFATFFVGRAGFFFAAGLPAGSGRAWRGW